MSEGISELLKKCAGPAACARAPLAGSLFESLDETVDEGAEAEWQKEIPRRTQELDSGEVKPVAWGRSAPANLRHPPWPVDGLRFIPPGLLI